MSDIIQLLPDAVANQIAAGEVVQRPASVVKELVENAVDAGSTSISLIIKDAGRTLIQVVDNGAGMSETDARLSFERHATSKIRAVTDIFGINTFGFRGEALASIASVAEVELKTRKNGSDLGTSIVISGSEVLSQEQVSCPVGSIFSVKNIFYNVPARRKFLKSNSVELRHIINEFQHVTLCHPEIAFTFVNNGTEVFNLPVSNLKQRIVGLMGKSMANNLIDVDTDTSIVKVSGFIGKPENAKKTAGEQFFFVNGRYFRSPYLQKSVMNAYSHLLQSDQYPAFFIYLTVDPAAIDINIHPTKTEIKFEDENAIWQIINASIRESIGKFSVAPSIDFDTSGKIDIPVFHDEKVSLPEVDINPSFNPFEKEVGISLSRPSGSFSGYSRNSAPRGWQKLYEGFPSSENHPFETVPSPAFSEDVPAEQTTIEAADNTDQPFFQLKGRYILTPVKSGMMVIDQVRAHQRILYEYYSSVIEHHTGIMQKELFPQTVEMNLADYAMLMGIADDLQYLGWDIRPSENSTIAVFGSPASLSNHNFKDVLEGVLQELKNNDIAIQESTKGRLARSMAVASSIKVGQLLSVMEMQDLFDKLFACSSPNISPQGRATLFILEMDELEKRFK